MTTKESIPFFSHPSNLQLLQRFSRELRTTENIESAEKGITQHLDLILHLIISNTSKFDEFCTVNIEWIGNQFLLEIENYFGLAPEKKEAAIRSIFTRAYRFLCEFDFTQPTSDNYDLEQVLKFVQENIDDFTAGDRQQLIYTAYRMPVQVAKRLINHPSVGDFRRFADTIESSKKLKADWDKNLDERQKLLSALDENLKKIKTAYNFVGLVNGFQQLTTQKEKERSFSFFSLVFLAALMILLPALQILFVTLNFDKIEQHKNTLAFTLPTIIAIEIIILYFFRVVLHQFKSVKAQLLQLELRVTLCQFIQSYSEYAEKIKATDSGALAKFEALIFSSIVTEGGEIPSTFDGIEQIANLIKSIKGNSS